MMRTCHDIEPQLSLLVDELLPVEAEADVRAHVSGCASCRGVLTDLERLRQTARQLGPLAPPQHVWLEIAGQVRLDGAEIHDTSRRSSRTNAARQWIGLAAGLVLVTAVLYFLRGSSGPATEVANNVPPPEAVDTVDPVMDEVKLATAPAHKAITELEAMTRTDGATMDTAIAAVFRENLDKIDRTIVESQTALSEYPESESARDSLFEALRRKISVLQTMVSLINEMRLGDQEGAARAAESLGKKS